LDWSAAVQETSRSIFSIRAVPHGLPAAADPAGTARSQTRCENTLELGIPENSILETVQMPTAPIFWQQPRVGMVFNCLCGINCFNACKQNPTHAKNTDSDRSAAAIGSALADHVDDDGLGKAGLRTLFATGNNLAVPIARENGAKSGGFQAETNSRLLAGHRPASLLSRFRMSSLLTAWAGTFGF